MYRQVNEAYRNDFDDLICSGLYNALIEKGVLISHEEADIALAQTGEAYKIIEPRRISFISYPYEWCFSQLKDAALATLDIQKIALEHGMSLKDASAYNIQFENGKPIFIDTLSFEAYKEGEPWVAYRQFCQHFLAPLALMSYTDVRLNQLMRVYIDGIPLDLAGALLPASSRLKPGIYMHLHLHGKAQAKYANQSGKAMAGTRKIGKNALLGLIDSLESTIRKLWWEPKGTEWADYYEANNNYSSESLEHKRQLVIEFIDRAKPKTVWDLGANTGFFSRLAGSQGIPTVAFDIDPAAVELDYRHVKKESETNILPLVLDLTNPSPSTGWSLEERMSFLDRGPVDMVMALALIHHLGISNNLPFEYIADFLSKICRWLIIEFVPKEDSQVQKLLANRTDIFDSYSRESFEVAFGAWFEIKDFRDVRASKRSLYLMRRIEV
ncbi:MAG: class I SAM-dependent methyltransferase [Candidatus Aquicultorales bacterium]